MNDFVIEKLTTYFTRGLEDPSQDNIAVLQDGITVVVLNVPKTLFLLLVAFLLGILKTVLIVMLFYGTIRRFSKGVHARTSWGCFIAGMVNYLGIAYLSNLIVIPQTIFNLILCMLMPLYAIYAPALTAERPVGKRQYKRLKLSTLSTLIFFCIIGNIFIEFKNIILLAVISQVVCIVPFTYNRLNYKRGEVYCEETN